jgi:hypothetical protein
MYFPYIFRSFQGLKTKDIKEFHKDRVIMSRYPHSYKKK